jgi:WD40 repeat protein
MKRTLPFIRKCWGFDPVSLIVPIILLTANSLPGWGQDHEPVSTLFRKHNGPVKALAFSKDGRWVATGGEDKRICLWDVQTGELVGAIENQAAVRALEFTGKGEMLAACGRDIRLIDRTGRLIRTFSGYTTDIWSIGYHEGTKRITAGSYAKSIRVWDVETGKPTITLEGHEKSCLPVSYNRSGDRIASGSLDMSLRLWDAVSGNQQHKMELHSENIFAVCFHPSGKYVASASADKTIRLWRVDDGQILRTYSGHSGAVLGIQFSPEGNHLISCSADRTLILWETATARKLYLFTGHTDRINAVRFSPDGTSFASVSDDQTLRIWPLEKRYYVEEIYRKELEQAMASSPLFGPRKENEGRQAYAEREQLAAQTLDQLFKEYYQQYMERIRKLSSEDITLP